MSALQLRIIKRAIKNRLSDGEVFEEIVKDYPKLTENEIAEIKLEIGITEETENEERAIQ